MTITVDCMFSVDLMVEDTVKTANLLAERLGLPALRPTWTDSSVDHLAYMRAYHPFSHAAPTLIEIIQPSSALPAVSRQSGDRPVKTHATVFVTKTFPEVIDNLEAKRLRHFNMPDPGDGLARCFTGIDDFQPGSPGNAYDPTVDGHLFMEIISWGGTALATRDVIPQELGAGGITRVMSRSYLVRDIDQTLHQLDEIFQWDQAAVQPSEDDQVRYTTLQPLLPASAALELIQPKGETGRHGEFFTQWGVGPHAIRFGVRGLDAKADDLDGRGTHFSENVGPGGQRVLLVDPSDLDGIIVEFAEDPLTV
jgi:hypothetical protein